MVNDFSSSGEHMYLTNSIAASWFGEYLETISCQPPSVAACVAPSPSPIGNWATPTFPTSGESAAWVTEKAYGQLRMNAALPGANALRDDGSLYVVTSSGEIVPTQPRARSNEAIACGLLTVTVPSGSMMRPPPFEYCHSRASQVRPS